MSRAVQGLECLFCAQKERPEGFGAIELADLSPLLRVLLVMDGTLTQLLEAYTLQTVEVVLLDQRTFVLTREDPWLDAGPGTEVIDRQIMLRGLDSGQVYGFADSRLVADRLSSRVLDGLVHGQEGVGRLLNQSRSEMRRERLWFGRETVDLPPEATVFNPGQAFLSRCYRMISGGKPLMIITEKFPLDLDL